MAAITSLRLASTPAQQVKPHSYANLPQQTHQLDYQLLKFCQEFPISYDKVLLLTAQGANPMRLWDNQSALKIACDLVAKDNGQDEVNVRILKLFLSKIPALQPSSANASPSYNKILLTAQGTDFLCLENDQSALKIACNLVAQDNGQNEINVQILKIFLSKIPTLQPLSVNPSYVGFLPSEVWDHILNFLPRDRKFIDLALVSKGFQNLVEQRLQKDWSSAIWTLPISALQAEKIEKENPTANAIVKMGIFLKKLFPKDKITTASLKELVQKEIDLSLKKLWAAIKKEYQGDQLLPNFTNALEIRSWFKTEEARPILATIVNIDLSFQKITILPSEIDNLTNLQQLYLPDNQLQELPKEIGNLTNLNVLHLQRNQLQELPKEIGNLANLQRLYLSGNQLQELPKEIGNLANLQQLYLPDNKLQGLPKEIGNLANLQQLHLADNQLQELPKEIGNLANLQQLYLPDNKLQELPKEIGNLAKLQQLHLADNQLQELPKEIGNLVSLQLLDLTDNQLQELPKEIGNLTNLQELYLSGNQLQELPKEIGNLAKLYLLDLDKS